MSSSMWDAAYGFVPKPTPEQPQKAAEPPKPPRNAQAAYRARLKAQGICIRASKRNPHPAREGKATCTQCNTIATAAMKAARNERKEYEAQL